MEKIKAAQIASNRRNTHMGDPETEITGISIDSRDG